MQKSRKFLYSFRSPNMDRQDFPTYTTVQCWARPTLRIWAKNNTCGACCSSCCLWFCSCKRAVASNNLLYSFNHLLFITNKPNLAHWCWKASNNNNTVIIANWLVWPHCKFRDWRQLIFCPKISCVIDICILPKLKCNRKFYFSLSFLVLQFDFSRRFKTSQVSNWSVMRPGP